ncbi:MAG: succinate dehydrogenase, cytochrome b556 subunit [Burkholderiales bacterium]
MTSIANPPKPRPKHLDLMKIRLPLPGWVSILHRVSGAGLFLFLPLLLKLLDMSLGQATAYETVAKAMSLWWVKVVMAGLIWAYLHHFCAGIRFLLLDMHKGITLPAARAGAAAVFWISLPLTGLVVWRLLF